MSKEKEKDQENENENEIGIGTEDTAAAADEIAPSDVIAADGKTAGPETDDITDSEVLEELTAKLTVGPQKDDEEEEEESEEEIVKLEDIIEDMLDEAERLLAERKFRDLRPMLNSLEPQDIAILLGRIPKEDLPLLFRILPKGLAADTFVEMDSEEEALLINSFSDDELNEVMAQLFLDDTVDIIEEMPANVVSRVLRSIPKEKRRVINEILNYPDDSAGSIMTIEYIDLRENMTVAESMNRIRHIGLNKETIYTCYVTDDKRHLLGVVTALELMTSNPNKKISDIMETNVISVNTGEDKEDVANVIQKYDFLAVPVVDKENRLVGIVTVDDAIDVLSEEAEEDFAKMAAITPTDKPYLKTGVFTIWKSRIIWLLLLMVSATFTGMIITSFENALAATVVLTAFIPMLMDTGGNSGSQASVTVIRALSLGDVEFADILRVLWKEFRVSILCGVTLAAATFVKIQLVDNLLMHNDVSILVSLVVCVTLACTVVIAKLIGCSLPLLAEKLGFDPAVMASPFITTIVDAVSLLVYFGIASALLGL